MSVKNLPIWRDANRFLLAIEKVVKHFPRYHTTARMQEVEQCRERLPKYTLGSELRKNSLEVCNLVHMAWQQQKQRCELLLKLTYLIDEIKIQLHLAKKLNAMPALVPKLKLIIKNVKLIVWVINNERKCS